TEKLGPIAEIRGPHTFVSLVMAKKALPGGLTRFCTQELKFEVIRNYLAGRDDEVINAVGVRREESVARATVTEWEWSDDLDCEVWRPLAEWKLADVIAIHRRHGLSPNPLYAVGFSRVGCFPCINWNKDDIALGARSDPEFFTDRVRDLERAVGE